MEVKSKDVKEIIKATFKDYRKRKVWVTPTTKVKFWGVNWSGGSVSFYRACTIDGKPLVGPDMSLAAPWDNPYEGLEVDLPKGAVIVKGGFFCGKPSQITLYVHPDNMPRMIEG
jgi:hypothetical protein